ncbi:MAG: hypothetical protein IH940_05490 [Acidobacteria bacterium]|nr:hypothetical protein [Acidobacteriota bacterium]
MGKASSSKKVARAARAGSTASSSERRDFGFPLAVFVIILLGLSLVVYSRISREATSAPRVDPQDHWHSAFGVYDCSTDSFLSDPQSQDDPDGIHSHQDGLMHIHPFNSSASGKNAQLHVFLEAMGMDIDEEAITLETGESLEAGTDCDGEEAIIQVVRWDADNLELKPDVFTEDLGDVRFRKNREAFVVALAPPGAEIEFPSSMAELDRASPSVIDPTDGGASNGGASNGGASNGGADADGSEADAGGADAESEPDPGATEVPEGE